MENWGAGTITQATYAGNFLRISVTRSEGGALVSLDGRLTIDSSPALREQLLTILQALKTARVRKTGLELTGLHDRPRYLLEVTGLLSLFET